VRTLVGGVDTMTTAFEVEKFKNLILYVSKKSENDRRFGAVKLNKILYYADFDAYRRLGQPITGATYQCLDEGPAPRELVPVRDSMIGESIKIESVPVARFTRQRIVALTDPDESLFTEAELRIVDQVMEAMRPMNGAQVTELSHTEPGWIQAETSDDIEYETVWLQAGDPLPPVAEQFWVRWRAEEFENYRKDLEENGELSLEEVKNRYSL